MSINTTDKYIHIRVENTNCEKIRTKALSKEEGILARLGISGSDSSIQSYIFKKSKGWTEEKAKQWVENHGNYVIMITETDIEKAWTREDWSTAYINDLPDSAFAYIEPAYKSGDSDNKNARHLPHHDGPGDLGSSGSSNKNIDLPHLRNALARVNQIKPVTDSTTTSKMRKSASSHLEGHKDALDTED